VRYRAEHSGLGQTPHRVPVGTHQGDNIVDDVIAGRDPADPVTAASQGKRADSYLRFLDKDGARLGVVHQLFTSEDADPGAMARALARNVSDSRRQGRAAAVGSVKGRSPAPTGTGKMRRFWPFAGR